MNGKENILLKHLSIPHTEQYIFLGILFQETNGDISFHLISKLLFNAGH